MPSLTYGILNQRHAKYRPELFSKLRDLYEGGFRVQENAHLYLPKLVGEHDTRFRERIASSAFIGYMGQIVDHFAANLFSQPLAVTPVSDGEPAEAPDKDFYEAFAGNSDLAGNNIQETLRGAFTTALVLGRAIVAVDLPTLPVEAEGPKNRSEEVAGGLDRAYAFEVEPERLIDWKYDNVVRKSVQLPGNGVVELEIGKFEFAILKTVRCERKRVSDARGEVTEEFKVWQRDPDTGVVFWQRYDISYPADRHVHPKDDDVVDLAASGFTTFTSIPLVEVVLPKGLWVGNKIGPLNLEHYQRRSALNASENRSLVAVPYVKLGTEIGEPHGELPSEVQQNPTRGLTINEQFQQRGYVVLGAGDDIGYAEPTGGANEIAESRLSKLVDEMFRISHLMASSVSNTSTALGRSGASKTEDRRATVIILQAFGAIVREFAERIYETVSDARKEPVDWVAHGLDRFEIEDREALIKEAAATTAIVTAIPSETLHTIHALDMAERVAPAMSPEEHSAVKAEIATGIKTAAVEREALKKAAQQALNEPGEPNEQQRINTNGPGGGRPSGNPSRRNRPSKG